MRTETERADKKERFVMVRVIEMTEELARSVKDWPPYPEGFEQMDFVLREGGWVDGYFHKDGAQMLAIFEEDAFIGLSGVHDVRDGKGEVFIALHPDYLNKGYGTKAMMRTLDFFFDHGIEKITLGVRKNNLIAQHVYEKIGFAPAGESTHIRGGVSVEFFDMFITKAMRTGNRTI